jgi:hypothetical protein
MKINKRIRKSTKRNIFEYNIDFRKIKQIKQNKMLKLKKVAMLSCLNKIG